MPLFDYLCMECSAVTEVLIAGAEDQPQCRSCGSKNLKRLLSATSSLSGSARDSLPSGGDTTCCGSAPGQGGCAGPGSCCGKGPY